MAETSIIATRKRRSNAGNKMRKLIDMEEQEQELRQHFDEDDEINLLFQEDEQDDEFQVGAENNEDDAFTDDSESSDEGEEEEETVTRARKSKKLGIPVIKKVSKKAVAKAKPVVLDIERRTSSRKATMQNAIQVQLSLEESEKRRQEILARMKPKSEYKELTQEEKLAEAEHTEKVNLLSLNKYREQELSRKKMQRQMFNKRKQLENVIRVWSGTTFLTVEDELRMQEREREIEARKNKKRKYTKRKKKAELEAGAGPNTQAGDGPSVQAEGEPSVQAEGEPRTQAEGEPSVQAEGEANVQAEGEPGSSTDTLPKLEPQTEETPAQEVVEDLPAKTEAQDTGSIKEEDTEMKDIPPDQQATSKEPDTAMAEDAATPAAEPDHKDAAEAATPATEPDHKDATEAATPAATPADTEQVEELPYEGPAQKVDQEILSLMNFSQTPISITALLLGEQATLPGNRRLCPMETIYRISSVEAIKPKEKITDFSILDKFPSFGQYDRGTFQEVEEEINKEVEVEITTQAPSGVHLPIGLRKKCLINGHECNYFDPKNGVPYSDVEAYRIIQDIQNGDSNYKWYGFSKGGLFLREVRPARGVPPGFNAPGYVPSEADLEAERAHDAKESENAQPASTESKEAQPDAPSEPIKEEVAA